ncbi:CapA family protein [Streptomyces sp. NPDC096205]|uniref:CapA family protein n=1 Tax=Streptomyces sp. NPDC096205 TaxID=3366081 RepID=UPI003821055E
MGREPVSLFLCGDVMLGRGVDQVLPHPLDPAIPEQYVRDARDYVALAEAVHGAVPRGGGFGYPWGEALALLDAAAPHARIVNLETAVTEHDRFAPGKAVHYRMHPANLPALAVARPDVCVLANNHVLDYGRQGLADTLDALAGAGLPAVGAGADLREAGAPVILRPHPGVRLAVFGLATASSGVPHDWAATARRSGVHQAGDTAVPRLLAAVKDRKRAGDLVVVSVHMGSNWGYSPARSDRELTHALIDAGADLVHGHSSHHPRPLEVHRGRLILHGCGDLVNDYEGIGGQEQFRDDLRLLYFAELDPDDGHFQRLRMVPLRSRRLRLERAPEYDVLWLHGVLDRISRPYGIRVDHTDDPAPLVAHLG